MHPHADLRQRTALDIVFDHVKRQISQLNPARSDVCLAPRSARCQTWIDSGPALFSIVSAFAFHAALGDQCIHLLKNLAMAGGLLQVAAFGAGAFGIDALGRRGAMRRVT